MRNFPVIVAGISCLLGVSQVFSIPTKDVVVSRDVQVISPGTDIAVRNWTHENTTSHSAVGHVDASIHQTAVVVAAIYASVQIVSGVCAATAAIGTVGVAVCGVVAIAAIFTSFFALFRASSGLAGNSPVRSIVAPAPGIPNDPPIRGRPRVMAVRSGIPAYRAGYWPSGVPGLRIFQGPCTSSPDRKYGRSPACPLRKLCIYRG
jgi:hypothetical protein